MPDEMRSIPIGRLGWIQIDCADPERLAPFWATVLGTTIEDRLGDPPQYINLAATDANAPHVSFQRVPEPKVVKNRLHFDLAVDFDFHEHGYSWRRMADPDGTSSA